MTEVLRVSYDVFKQAAQITTVYFVPIIEGQTDGYVAGTGTKDFVYVSKILDSADVTDFISSFVPGGTQVELEDDVIASPTLQVNNTISRFDLGGTSFIYTGSAQVGTLDSEAGWTIKRFELDTDGNVIDKKITQQNAAIWDDRVTETYF